MAFRASRPHSALPFLVGAILAKKIALYTIARTYGFPRLYRRLLELERTLYPEASPAVRNSVRWTLKSAIRSPENAVKLLSGNPAALALVTQVRNIPGVSSAAMVRGVEALTSAMKAAGVDVSRVLAVGRQQQQQTASSASDTAATPSTTGTGTGARQPDKPA